MHLAVAFAIAVFFTNFEQKFEHFSLNVRLDYVCAPPVQILWSCFSSEWRCKQATNLFVSNLSPFVHQLKHFFYSVQRLGLLVVLLKLVFS